MQDTRIKLTDAQVLQIFSMRPNRSSRMNWAKYICAENANSESTTYYGRGASRKAAVKFGVRFSFCLCYYLTFAPCGDDVC